MNDSRNAGRSPQDDAIESLLGRAEPRTAPPVEDERYVRDAVRAEWLDTVRRRRNRRRLAGMAVAATVVLTAAVTLNALRAPSTPPVMVATIDKSFGSVYLQTAATDPGNAQTSVVAGERLSTGDDAAVGMTWMLGGSLRVDANTQVEFLSATEIRLNRGRLYVDSAGASPPGSLVIRTSHGTVSHVGTQYMTATDDGALTVSVREGRVRIDGRYHDQTVDEGRQVRLAGRASPSIVNVRGTGADWEWLERVAPSLDVDGKSAWEFLQWVGRETGHTVEFVDANAEQLARDTRLIGTVDRDPRTELRLRMMTMDMQARFDAERSALVVGYSL